jgi:hypothetical protein
MRDPWATLGWPLGGPRAIQTQTQTQSQSAEGCKPGGPLNAEPIEY